jgi:hypothetical protein
MDAINLSFDLTTPVSDPIQCSICGQPNQFGRLCESCLAKLSELEADDDETRRTYMILGLRCEAQEFGGSENG